MILRICDPPVGNFLSCCTSVRLPSPVPESRHENCFRRRREDVVIWNPEGFFQDRKRQTSFRAYGNDDLESSCSNTQTSSLLVLVKGFVCVCLLYIRVVFRESGYRRSDFVAIKDDFKRFRNLRNGLRSTVLYIQARMVWNS